MRRTNRIMDEIRLGIPAEVKIRTELSVGIANRIYEILERRGLSQKEFANMMGKTETEVSRWLSGTHNLTISTISKITAALGEEIITPASTMVGRYDISINSQARFLSEADTPAYGKGLQGESTV